jgi:alanine dehydrogenase
MLKRKICCVAYETVEKDGKLPLLKPMSEVAGQMSVIMGAYYLAKPFQGRGMLLSLVENTTPSKTVIIGGGVVGENALMNAYGLRGEVVLFELNDKRIAELKKKYPKARFEKSDKAKVEKEILDADLVVGAVLVEGAKAPKVISKDMVLKMQDGSVIVDVAIDQGGCVETSHATTHTDPVYKVGGVTHYCVANMPGAYPRTSTIALTTATLPYAVKLANKGLKALKEDDGFMRGLNAYKGKVTHKGVADAFGLPFVEPKTLL